MGGKRVLVALAVAGAAFGIATAVQASIPDSEGIVHSCYNTSRAHGTPTGAMRAIDTDRIDGNCASWEGAVDLATPEYVQNVVTSTINQTSFMVSFTGDLGAGPWVSNNFCPTGYILTDLALAASDQSFGSNGNIAPHSFYNVGELTTGIPDGSGHYFFNLAATTSVTAHHTCVDGRVFGLAGPALPIKQAEKQAAGSFQKAS